MKNSLLATLVLCTFSAASWADDGGGRGASCSLGASAVATLKSALEQVVPDGNGGLFKPNMMWAAVVDRNGILCGVAKTGDAWPGSRAIAIAKAETANDFSNNKLALSTANLYAATQPGGSLYGLNNSNPFNPFFNAITTDNSSNPLRGNGVGLNPGGIITFGGGVALYQDGQVIGGLGVSGDTACTDHTIAYRMRALVHLDKVPAGVADNGTTDNIIFSAPGVAPVGFQHPPC